MNLEDKFDVVVVGTGLTESIVAGAAARIGKTVLHLDQNDYYGNHWAAFSFSQILNWVSRNTENAATDPNPLESSEDDSATEVKLSEAYPIISNVEAMSYLLNEEPEAVGEDASHVWTMDKFKANDRKFGIDLSPRLLFSRGPMVDILVKSNVHRYLDFKPVTRILSCSRESSNLIEVPCSRCDIFNSKAIDVVEKRLLMRFMSQCLENNALDEDLKEFGKKPFAEYLKSKGFSEILQGFIINAIALVDQSCLTDDAVGNVRKFLKSLGVYGNTPFLYTLYGSGELPQAFCRLCAVFGGTYCLNRQPQAITVDRSTNTVTHISLDGQKIQCNFLVTAFSVVPRTFVKEIPTDYLLSRAIFISTGSVLPSKTQEITFFRLPTDEDIGTPVSVIEVGHGGHSVPNDLYIIYCWCSAVNDAKKDLLPVAKRLFNFTAEEDPVKPRLLWSCYYNQKFVDCTKSNVIVNSLYITSPPSDELDFDFAVAEARDIFSKMFPDEEFLPRAPDPDEIILDDPQVENHNNEVMH